MIAYHDQEWGVPVHDDRTLFEFLVLEGAQAGLSWSTILHKREGYRAAFADFDAARVARFGARDIERLMNDAGIVRNRLKIESTIDNARADPGGVARGRFFQSLHLEIRARCNARRARAARAATTATRHPVDKSGIRRALQGSQASRLPLRGKHDYVCFHASDRSRR